MFIRSEGYNHDPNRDFVIEEQCTDLELFSAEYVPFLIEGDFIDSNQDGEPLDHFSPGKCQACFLPPEETVPEPLSVSEVNSRRIQDIYWAHNGVIVVSEKFMSAVGAHMDDQVRTGQVIFKQSSRPRRLKDRYFWLRPRFSLGREIQSEVKKVCETCGTQLEVRKVERGDKFRDARIILEHFGDRKLNIALSGNWYGQRTREKPMSQIREIYISGGMYFFLTNQKLKGLVRPSNVVVCDNLVL